MAVPAAVCGCLPCGVLQCLIGVIGEVGLIGVPGLGEGAARRGPSARPLLRSVAGTVAVKEAGGPMVHEHASNDVRVGDISALAGLRLGPSPPRRPPPRRTFPVPSLASTCPAPSIHSLTFSRSPAYSYPYSLGFEPVSWWYRSTPRPALPPPPPRKTSSLPCHSSLVCHDHRL